jgi:lipopolysaccharide export LptBFGC system permease protein LptF
VKAIRATYTTKLKTKPPKFSGSYAAAVASATTAGTGIRKGAPLPSSAAKGPRTTTFPLSSSTGSSPTAAAATSPTNKWVTPGQDNKKNAWNNSATKKKKKNKGTGVFAAMMANDDSDSDVEAENDDGNDSDEEHDDTTTPTNKDATASTSDNPDENEAGASGKKKKGKKKKSKGGKKKNEADMTEDELLNATAAANRALEKQKEEVQEKLHPAVDFVKNYLIPFILWFIAFIVSLFFGKPKKKQKKS